MVIIKEVKDEDEFNNNLAEVYDTMYDSGESNGGKLAKCYVKKGFVGFSDAEGLIKDLVKTFEKGFLSGYKQGLFQEPDLSELKVGRQPGARLMRVGDQKKLVIPEEFKNVLDEGGWFVYPNTAPTELREQSDKNTPEGYRPRARKKGKKEEEEE